MTKLRRALSFSIFLIALPICVSFAQAQVPQKLASAQEKDGLAYNTQLDPSVKLRHLRESLQSLEVTLASTDSEESVYISATEGRDSDSCGTQNQPCLTVTQGLKRAREIQTGPKAKTIELINIEIAPGTYTESVVVKLDWIRLRGAGAGASLIQSPSSSAVFVSSSQPVLFEGLTMAAPGRAALVAVENSFIKVNNCEFRDSRSGIGQDNSSSASISASTFSNNLHALTVSNGSTALVSDLVITGQSVTQGTGVSVADASVVALQNVSISQTQRAVAVCCSSSCYTFGGLNITNNTIGIDVTSSLLELLDSLVNNNSVVGLRLDLGASALIVFGTLNNNGTGITVNGNSYLDLGGSEVKFNNLGVAFDLFGKGVLRSANISNNTTNTQTSRGGEFFVEP